MCLFRCVAVQQAAGDEARDPGPTGGARQGEAGVGADSDGTHSRTQTQVNTRLNVEIGVSTELKLK